MLLLKLLWILPPVLNCLSESALEACTARVQRLITESNGKSTYRFFHHSSNVHLLLTRSANYCIGILKYLSTSTLTQFTYSAMSSTSIPSISSIPTSAGYSGVPTSGYSTAGTSSKPGEVFTVRAALLERLIGAGFSGGGVCLLREDAVYKD